MSSKEEILERIRRNTGKKYEMPDLNLDAITYADKISTFIQVLEASGGEAHLLSPDEDLNVVIRSYYPQAERIGSNLPDITCATFNPDDLAEVYRSQFTDTPYKVIEFPCAEPQPCAGHQDYVTDKDGNVIGISSVPTYSSHFHAMISHTIIDVDKAEEGREVLVQWGDYGKKIINLRARIAKFPYIHGVMDNRDYDLSTVPCGV